MPNDDRFRGAWFSAHVLELKDGKAHVCYNDLQDEGKQRIFFFNGLFLIDIC